MSGILSTSANREQLEKPGSLNAVSRIPSAIRDAMTLVKNLGKRSLWLTSFVLSRTILLKSTVLYN